MNETAPHKLDDDRELMFAVINSGRALEQSLEDALAPVGLSLAKFGALTHLIEAGRPLRLSECAERMTCVRSNVTQLMDRLESDGLVRRTPDPVDRRAVRAELTRRGVERQAAGARTVAEVQRRLFQSLGARQADLRRALAAFD